MTADDRDIQIAHLIRKAITKETAEFERLGYEIGSHNGAYFQGRVVGLRLALAFVDPNPQS